MDQQGLTHSQREHANAFDKKTVDLPAVDFEHYKKERYGPWDPYWYVYDSLRQRVSRGESRLLCIGCGNGRDALIYARMGYEVHGIDISPRAVEIAQGLAAKHGYSERATFSVQPAEKLDFPSESFDVVCGVNVLHHVNIPQCVPELSRVLKRGGYAIFKEPLITPMRDKFRNSALVTRLIPKGTKNRVTGKKYELVPGEKNLDRSDLALLREQFGNLTVHRWHVLAKLSIVMGNRPFLARADGYLFKILPFVRRLGDQAVFVSEKP